MKRIVFLIIPLALLLLVAMPIISILVGYTVECDIRYADGEECIMDIYTPWGAENHDSIGCVILIHGGSWSSGDKSDEELRARLIASRGYMAVTINYTLFTAEADASFDTDTMLDDIDAAISKVKSYAKERGITIDKIATSGYSAGAHLALLYAYSRSADSPIEIAFTASMAGPTKITPEIWGEDFTVSIGRLLTTEDFDKDYIYTAHGESALRDISPTTYISESSVPTLILQGAKDSIVPPQNAEALASALESARVAHEYIILPNSTHALSEDIFGFIGYHLTLLEWCNDHFS